MSVLFPNIGPVRGVPAAASDSENCQRFVLSGAGEGPYGGVGHARPDRVVVNYGYDGYISVTLHAGVLRPGWSCDRTRILLRQSSCVHEVRGAVERQMSEYDRLVRL